jgi:hypothetical protein
MSAKLPVLSGIQLIKILAKKGSIMNGILKQAGLDIGDLEK